jgi:hypothetical protein
LAKELSILFHSLSATAGTRLISCGHALAGITTGLGGLFGAIGGDVIVSAEVSEVWLSPVRRRALILMAVELVTRTLLRNAARSSACRMGVTDRVAPGVVYTTFHHPDTQANVVTTDQSDWATNCPEYKVTAVQVTPSNGTTAWQDSYRAHSEEARRILPVPAAE